MSYYEAQMIDCQGIPTREYRTEPEIIQTIMIEFTPRFNHDYYGYSQPQFVLGEQIILTKEWLNCQENKEVFFEQYEVYYISALDLVELTLVPNKLYQPPHWRYGIRGVKGQNLQWFEENDLISLSSINFEGEF